MEWLGWVASYIGTHIYSFGERRNGGEMFFFLLSSSSIVDFGEILNALRALRACGVCVCLRLSAARVFLVRFSVWFR